MGASKDRMIQREIERQDAQHRLLDNVDELLEAHQQIGQLQAELELANSWRAKLKDHLLGGLIGAVIGWVIGKML